jgi:two-component system, OmpR family, sensor kinase
VRRPRLGIRSRLLVAVVGAVALALVVGVITLNLLLRERLSASATSLAKAQAAAQLGSLEVRGGRLVTPERPDERAVGSQVWVFAGSRLVERPAVARRLDAQARAMAGGPARAHDAGEEARLYALPVVQNGRRYGTVVSAVSLDPYEESEQTALIGSIILAAVLLGAIFVASRWMLGRAFLPVSTMTEDAASWSAHDLDRRFDLGEPYDELTRLASTLDGLLERIAASLRHEQRFTAEVSHELRTPLARISGEAELMLRRERTPDEYRTALEAIQRNAQQMTRTVDALVAAARQDAGLTRETSDAREAVHAAVVNAGSREPKVRLTLPQEPIPVAVDQELVERMVQPLVDNAVRYGTAKVEVSVARNGAAALIRVDDDGPGVSEDERASIFEPGTRGTAAGESGDGAGLGLALARRIARSAGGEVSVTPSREGGRFTLRLPLAR